MMLLHEATPAEAERVLLRALVEAHHCRLPPPLHLLRIENPLTPVGTELSGVQASGLQHHRELVSGAPALRILLGCRHHFSMQLIGVDVKALITRCC